MSSAPDLILRNGSVITVDEASSTARAVAVTDGRITAVGTDHDVVGLAGRRTRVVDVGGGAVLPGINDSHLHGAMLGAYWPGLWMDGLTGGGGMPVPRELRTAADRRAALHRAWEVLLPLGITSYTEPGLNTQPSLYGATCHLLEEAIGASRMAAAFPLRSALDTGVRVCLSSDAPVLAPDWRRGVADAVSRHDRGAGPGQRIAVMEAIRGYTIEGARQDHAEDWKGSIEVGKVADLCVLADDPLRVPAADIAGIDVTMTVVDGRIRYERGAGLVAACRGS